MLSINLHPLVKIMNAGWILLSIACGTVHQFMPPQPLKPNEFRSMMTYSFDSNLFARGGSLGFGFYCGAGKNVNMGFGYQPPLGISHLTAVKYFNPQKSTYTQVYGSLNDFYLNFDPSPNFEFGGTVTRHINASYHSLSLGIWGLYKENLIYNFPRFPFWMLALKGGLRKSPAIGPELKYEFTNGDYAMSIQMNKGNTAGVIESERLMLENRPRIVISNDDIASFVFDYNTRRIDINAKNGEKYSITPKNPYIDLIGPDLDLMWLSRFNPKGNWDYYFVRSNSSPQLYELDFSALISDYIGKNDIVLGSFPPRKRDILKMIKWYKHDWSIGLGMTI